MNPLRISPFLEETPQGMHPAKGRSVTINFTYKGQEIISTIESKDLKPGCLDLNPRSTSYKLCHLGPPLPHLQNGDKDSTSSIGLAQGLNQHMQRI